MITDVISEKEFMKQIAEWTLENDKAALLPKGGKAEYIENFVLPNIEYTHTQSAKGKDGDVITLLKGGIHLKDWETKSGKKKADITFYKVLKTPASNPDCEPYVAGYIVCS